VIVTSPRRHLARLALAVTALTLAPVAATPAQASYADASVSTDVVTVPMVFPVLGPTSYVDTFLACRSGCTRRHFGQDLMGPKMRPLVAAFNGVVSSVKAESYVGEGNYITVRGDNGWSANYLHVNNDTPGTDDGKGTAQYAFAPGLHVGLPVVAGQLLGWSGDSGNAESTGPHLHFELRRGDSWSGTVYNAFSSLNHAGHLAAPRVSGPHPEGTYVKTSATSAVYEIRLGSKRLLRPEVMAERAVTPSMAVTISTTELASYPSGPAAQLPGGRAYQGPDGKTWLVTNGVRIAVPGATALKALGIPATRVHPTTDAALATVPVADPSVTLPATPVFEGALLHPTGTTDYYLVSHGALRLLPDTTTKWSWGVRSADAVPYSATTAAADPAFPQVGAPLPVHDGFVVQDLGGHRYVVSGGRRRSVGSLGVYRNYGWSQVALAHPSAAAFAATPAGSVLP
jgi:hypothetical protein